VVLSNLVISKFL